MTAKDTASDRAVEPEIGLETFPVRLATTVEVELPVVHRTGNGQFVVASNRLAKAGTSVVRPAEHPYFVVHVATGLRAPVPTAVGKHNLTTARQLANFLERAGYFDVQTGKPLAAAAVIRAGIEGWRP
ncbi:hypothetical protein [Pseudoclavibacter sp. VKM Ac-2888]|uniref:hypothetical protein n=1 Tax=Pseudoclavibacter sp. VKM Ac-2888 TaxID=2783830 RepID=UPI00188C90B3|nr:hypothetical protein [Pseudoclavibacter sp. VKM Ac-2888]MBF4549405.1 hypothetical protein [Pseudoclavibacter sp. VKM Ac-2888]